MKANYFAITFFTYLLLVLPTHGIAGAFTQEALLNTPITVKDDIPTEIQIQEPLSRNFNAVELDVAFDTSTIIEYIYRTGGMNLSSGLAELNITFVSESGVRYSTKKAIDRFYLSEVWLRFENLPPKDVSLKSIIVTGKNLPRINQIYWFDTNGYPTIAPADIRLTPAEEAEAIQDIATFLSNKSYDPSREFKYPKKIYARIPAYNWLGISVDSKTTQSLTKLSLLETSLIRNEIFARYGYPFKVDIWRKIFEKVTWYKLNTAFQPDSLTTAEKNNITAVKKEEAKSSHK